MADLKPCPFCGGKVSVAVTGDGTENWYFITRAHSKIEKNCRCRLFMESDKYLAGCVDSKEAARNAKQKLFEAWNRRYTPEEIDFDYGAEDE